MSDVLHSEKMTLKDWHITFFDNGFKSVARTKERFEKNEPNLS